MFLMVSGLGSRPRPGTVFEGFPLAVLGPGDFGEEDGPGFHFAAEDFYYSQVGCGHGAVEVEEGVGVRARLEGCRRGRGG